MVTLSGCSAVCAGVPLSVALMAKLNVPLAVGVPAMAHVVGFTLIPGGKAPAPTAKL
jgi:hypothetical protein